MMGVGSRDVDLVVSSPGFAPDPTPSHGAMLLLHHEDLEIGGPYRLRSGVSCSTDRCANYYTNGPSSCSVTLRGRPLIGRLLCY